MSKELLHFIDQIGLEKGLEREVVIQALEEALSSAIKRRLGTNLEMYTTVDRGTGEFKVSAEKLVVERVSNEVEEISREEAARIDPEAELGAIVRVPQNMVFLGRIAAQIAKQVIIQKVREAERDMIHSGYKDREGELITGRVSRRDRGDIIVELGKIEAILPKNQQIPHESFRIGDHVRAFIVEVQKASRGPQIILSRTDPRFVTRLFELEVPEIDEGVVEVKNVVREPGERAKVAVASNQRDVDPVGACVGVKGSRVQAVVRELRGEKIDIIEWSDDIPSFVKNSLSPAAIEEIRINMGKKRIMVVVPDEELAQAIGKKGQNVRLASQLMGWEIDIKSKALMEQEARSVEENALVDALAEILGIPIPATAALVAAGYDSLESLRDASLDELASLEPVGEETARLVMEKAAGEPAAGESGDE